MKITCNIIEDLLPLYIDDMVSEDSRQLVEEHLKECAACRKMLDEMKKENQLRTVSENAEKNMFYMLSETAWIRKNYPSVQDAENLMFNLDEFQKAHDRLPDTATDETSLPTGIENVYYVDPENIKEAFALWDYQDEPDKAQQKEQELAAKCHLIWSAD